MNDNTLLHHTACEQARQIKANTLSAQSLLSQQRDAIAAYNPTINAFVQLSVASPTPDEGVNPSALTGSTFAIKDNIDVQGMSSHGGLRAWHAAAATQDAPLVARLQAAGMTCMGKLNMHAMALGATNHNADFGDCYNPVRAGFTPGGSSGGSAAAVAAGLCGIALGTDTLGSVRIPAAYCGVVGFKPSFGALPLEGVIPLSRLLDHAGIIARGVEDVIAAFHIVADQRPVRATDSSAGQTFDLAIPGNLDDLAQGGVSAYVRRAFEQGLKMLENRGHRLHPIDFKTFTFMATRRAGLLLCEAELRGTLAATLASHREEIPQDLLDMLDFAGKKSAENLARAVAALVQGGQWLTQRVLPFDGLLLPTTPQPAFAMSATVPHNQSDLTAMANMSGAPAISLPLPVPEGELPVGLQLTGHRGEDQLLLEIALQIELTLASSAQ